MKTILLFFCLFGFVNIVNAQLQGRVIDFENKKPVAGASIESAGFNTRVTNDSGEFTFPVNVSLNVFVSSIGYHGKSVRLEPGIVTHIALQNFNLFLEPVEIKAIRAGDKSPFTKNDLTKNEIEKLNLGQDLPFLLNQLPSVTVNSDAGNGIGYTGIRIRGSDATRINMTINGIPYNDAESQGLFLVNLPDLASSLQSVQVQRGAGTSSNGAGAFGATMNFSTNETIMDPYANLSASYGSYNTRKLTVKAGTGLLHDHFTVDARISKIQSDGYIDRASSDLKSLYLSAAYLGKSSSLRLNVLTGKEKTYQAWYGILKSDLLENRTINYAGTEKPGIPYDNEIDNYQQDHYQLFFNHHFSPTLNFQTAFFLTKGKGYYEQYKASENYSDYYLQNAPGATTDLIRQLWLQNDFYGQVFSFQFKHAQTELTIGGGWNQYNGNHFGEIIWSSNGGISYPSRWYDLHADKKDLNVYVKYQYAITPYFFIFSDLQYRNVKYDLNGFRNNPSLLLKNSYGFVNPKAGISYVRNRNKIYFSYAHAAKEPNRDDFETGLTQQPRPEKLHDFELGYEKKEYGWSWGVTGYRMVYRNQLILTGRINDVGAYTRTNIERSLRTGIEMQGNVQLIKWLQAGANLTLSRNKIFDFTEYLDDFDNGGQLHKQYKQSDISFSPPVTGSATLTFLPVKNGEVSWFAKYISRQFLDNTSDHERSLSGFFVSDIRSSYKIQGRDLPEITITLLVNNVFNKRYEPNGYTYSYVSGGNILHDNYYYPMAGTNLMFGLVVKF
ncbi:MAG TPA: TonB-dependent receptor [Flavitalea sp.]|nr:TonB-dependent receptor [Flavitalea sp.]